MEITRLSTKGQIVIPDKLRRGYAVGSTFVVSKVHEMIVLKPVQGLSEKEKKEIKELKSIWDEIDSGKADAYSEKEFFTAMRKW
jgi:bifunctional DNA-binding transcriptional regulator/antitoxin component of YhaV-PrlF toxin-antitoxin module